MPLLVSCAFDVTAALTVVLLFGGVPIFRAQVLGGPRSSLFRAYRNMCVRAFLEVRKRRDKLIVLVEMMLAGNDTLPCFARGPAVVMAGLNERFLPKATSRQAVVFVHNLIDRYVPRVGSFCLFGKCAEVEARPHASVLSTLTGR